MYIWSMIQKELYACDKNTILKSILIDTRLLFQYFNAIGINFN